MPEFQLDLGDNVKQWDKFQACDQFTQGYIEAMFFTISDALKDFNVSDLSAAAWKQIKADCARFQRQCAKLLAQGNHTPEQAGRDFWFTRNGHGAGFWDRADDTYGGNGKALTDAANSYGELDLYRANNEKLYFT